MPDTRCPECGAREMKDGIFMCGTVLNEGRYRFSHGCTQAAYITKLESQLAAEREKVRRWERLTKKCSRFDCDNGGSRVWFEFGRWHCSQNDTYEPKFSPFDSPIDALAAIEAHEAAQAKGAE